MEHGLTCALLKDIIVSVAVRSAGVRVETFIGLRKSPSERIHIDWVYVELALTIHLPSETLSRARPTVLYVASTFSSLSNNSNFRKMLECLLSRKASWTRGEGINLREKVYVTSPHRQPPAKTSANSAPGCTHSPGGTLRDEAATEGGHSLALWRK